MHVRFCILLFSFMALAPFTRAQATTPFDVEWTTVADGVYAGIRPDSPRIPVMGTSVIVVGNDGVLVFDGGGAELQSEQVLDKILSLTPLSVTHIVISHWHGDHHLGIHKILERFPDAQIVSHEFTEAAMAGAPMDYIKPQIENGFSQSKKALIEIVATKTFVDGTPLSDEMVSYYARALEDADLIDLQM